jgi:hypothetical protein
LSCSTAGPNARRHGIEHVVEQLAGLELQTAALTWGTTLGMINLARLTAGWGLGTLPRTSDNGVEATDSGGMISISCERLPRVTNTLLR